MVSPALKWKSNDIGWDYEILVDPTNNDKVKCILCGKIVSGGIYRLKQHIGAIFRIVAKCPNASPKDVAKCKNSILEGKLKKQTKKAEEQMVRDGVPIIKIPFEDDEALQAMGSGQKRTLGPTDKFASPLDPDIPLIRKQQNINDVLDKERSLQVKDAISQWVYENRIPFSTVCNVGFTRMLEVVGRYRFGALRPSIYELRESLLKKNVERTKSLLKKDEDERMLTGCSIMSDAWTDRKRISIMNLCVNCRVGTCFLSSKEASNASHTSALIFEYVDKCIEEVGPQHVVQVVTDNASNNIRAANLLKEKRPNIFWTSCATHTINLMLEGIGKMPRFKKSIDQVKTFTKLIYAHHKTLALMRTYTKKRDIVRPGVIRFASSFLTLPNLMEKKSTIEVDGDKHGVR